MRFNNTPVIQGKVDEIGRLVGTQEGELSLTAPASATPVKVSIRTGRYVAAEEKFRTALAWYMNADESKRPALKDTVLAALDQYIQDRKEIK